jgi:hypothetical protein
VRDDRDDATIAFVQVVLPPSIRRESGDPTTAPVVHVVAAGMSSAAGSWSFCSPPRSFVAALTWHRRRRHG